MLKKELEDKYNKELEIRDNKYQTLAKNLHEREEAFAQISEQLTVLQRTIPVTHAPTTAKQTSPKKRKPDASPSEKYNQVVEQRHEKQDKKAKLTNSDVVFVEAIQATPKPSILQTLRNKKNEY